MPNPLIIAHRGSSAVAPENTLAAFRRAVLDGADGIELDVRLAADGVPIVFHDPTLRRITGIEERVADLTSRELSRIDVGSWFNRRFRKRANASYEGERIPTLAEALDSMEKFTGRLYIEMKCLRSDGSLLAQAVCHELRSSPWLRSAIVKSFDIASVAEVKKLDSTIRTAALFAPKVRNLLRKGKDLFRIAEAAAADELSLHYALATRRRMNEAARRGMPVTIWTVNHPRWLDRARALGIAAVITNDPVRLLAQGRKRTVM